MYAITSPLNGYFGGSLYARKGGKLWIKQMVIGALLVPALISITAFFINFIAIYYQAAKAIHFTSMVKRRTILVDLRLIINFFSLQLLPFVFLLFYHVI